MTKPKHPLENHINELTRYHYFCFAILYLCKIPVYWHIMNLIFLSPTIDFYCNGEKNHCPCDNPSWDKSVFNETMQTKFNIICEDAWLISFAQSMLYVGTLIGSLLLGFMADKYGRLAMFSLSCMTIGVCGCLVTTMPSITSYIIMRCLEGTGVGGAIVSGYVLLVEYCSTKHRDVVSALYHIPLNFGHLSMAGISYFLRDCDEFQLAVSIPMYLCVIACWFIYESPKWLLDKGKIDEALIVMQKIAKFNGNEASSDTIQAEMAAYYAAQSSQAHRKISFWEIFRHKSSYFNLLCMSFIYLVCGMGYYGVSQYIGKMSGDIHLNVAISGLLLMPGTIATAFLLRVLNRRLFLMLTNLASGKCLIAVICIPAGFKITRMILACIANTSFFMSFIIVFLYSVELFPTLVRNSVLGFLSVLSRMGQIIAPPINHLDSNKAGAIFGVAAILAAALCYILPETKNTDLPSTLEETKAISHKTRPPLTEWIIHEIEHSFNLINLY